MSTPHTPKSAETAEGVGHDGRDVVDKLESKLSLASTVGPALPSSQPNRRNESSGMPFWFARLSATA